MTSVTLYLDTHDANKPVPPLKEFEMPWGLIGDRLRFKIEILQREKGNLDVLENGVAQRAADFLNAFMAKFWANYEANRAKEKV